MFFLPLEGEPIFFTGTFKVPQLRDGTSSGQVPLHHSVLRESELLNSEDEILLLLATAGSDWYFKEYWVLHIGTEGVNLLNHSTCDW